ncbi:MAG: hypothetical protein WC712_07535 [Candidatus Brocadiia bacterium]
MRKEARKIPICAGRSAPCAGAMILAGMGGVKVGAASCRIFQIKRLEGDSTRWRRKATIGRAIGV